ncbi:MFS transporter [Vallicoccus soli]|uniref:MFS transporter n=1 Tax=Vallicoccus soli TaxID=2339232 RepID=UPI001059C8D5|nr:MFS transporter [Vallicoccus soli]
MTGLDLLRRRYVVLTFLRWFPTGLVIPVQVLLLSGRGLSVAQVGAVWAAYSLACALLELPSGALADALGRRAVLVVSVALGTAANLVLALGQAAPALVAGTLLAGTARALDSGPLQAWYVDAVHALDADADLKPGLARGATADSAGLALGALGGGALTLVPLADAGGDPLLSLSVPFLAAAAVALVQVALVVRWVTDVPRGGGLRAALAEVPATVRAGAALAGRNPVLRRLTALSTLLGVVLAGTELLAPLTLGGEAGAAAYSTVVTAGFAGTAVGAHLAPALARLLRGSGRGVVVSSLLVAAAAACVALPGWWAAAGAYVCLYAALGLGDPLTGELLHEETPSGQRTTLLSVQSLVLQAGGLAGTLGVPAIAGATSFGTAWAAVAGVAALGALVALGLPRGRTSPDPAPAPPVALG